MTLPFPALLVTHPGLGEGLLMAAEAILGERPPVGVISNQGRSPEELGAEIDRWLGENPGPAIILTDLGFGSCCQSARQVSRDRPTVGIVAGVNLPVLLALVRSREEMDLPDLLHHLQMRGQTSLELYLGGRQL